MFKALKQNIKERDGVCQVCGGTDNLTVDHIIPLVEGGTDEPENLQALCKPCNLRKGILPPFRQRVLNLFNGNIYYFKREIRDVAYSIRIGFQQFKDGLELKLKTKFAELDSRFTSYGNTVKILEGRIEGENKKSIILAARVGMLEGEVVTLKSRNVLLEEAIIKVERLSADRIMALQNYHGVEWQPATKTYKKINRRK